MKYAITILAALALASCAPVTQQLDETTGTTIAERCQIRKAAIRGYEEILAAGRTLSAQEQTALAAYRLYVEEVCLGT